MKMAAPYVFHKFGKCFAEKGCYSIYELKRGYDLENDVWVDVATYLHVMQQLTTINNKFSKASERDRVSEILDELTTQRIPFGCKVRFPLEVSYIRLGQGSYDSYIDQMTSAAAYVDAVVDRQTVSSTGAALAKMLPDKDIIFKHEREYGDAKQSFSKSLTALKRYGTGAHRFVRFDFERKFNLVWCCDQCCPEEICIKTCTDKFNDRDCSTIEVGNIPDTPSSGDCDTLDVSIFKSYLKVNEDFYGDVSIDVTYPQDIPTCAGFYNASTLDEIDDGTDLKGSFYFYRHITTKGTMDSVDVYKVECSKPNTISSLKRIGNLACNNDFKSGVQDTLELFKKEIRKPIDEEKVFLRKYFTKSCSFDSHIRLNEVSLKEISLNFPYIYAFSSKNANKIYVYNAITDANNKVRFIHMDTMLCD